MARLFGDAAADDRRAADEAASLWGVDVTITPRLPPSGYTTAASDPDRDPVTVRGVASFNPTEYRVRGRADGNDFKGATRFVSTPAILYIPPSAAATIPYRIAAGDLIEFDDEGDPVAFAVSRPGSPRMGFPGELVLILTIEDPAV